MGVFGSQFASGPASATGTDAALKAQAGRSLRARFTLAALCGVWAPLSLLAVATLMVGHWYTLPRPATEDPAVAAALNGLRHEGENGWLAVHVLYAECRCSQRVVDHLVQSLRPGDVHEKLLLVGEGRDIARRAEQAGIEVVHTDHAGLARDYQLTAAPLFAVYGPDRQARYMGGYTDRKQGPEIMDLRILAELRSEQPTRELPLFGCAVARDLQALLDPMGLKYGVRRRD